MSTTQELLANYAKNGNNLFGPNVKESVCADMLRLASKNYYNASLFFKNIVSSKI